jgi:hypothetical protein
MTSKTTNATQYMLTTPIPCRWVNKTYLNLCWPYRPLLARTGKASQHVLTKHLPCHRGNTKYISTRVDKTPLMTARPQCVFQLVLTKPILCQGKHKMHLNARSSNPSNASEDTKSITTCVGQTHLRPARTQNASQHVMIIIIPCQRGYKI